MNKLNKEYEDMILAIRSQIESDFEKISELLDDLENHTDKMLDIISFLLGKSGDE